MIYIDIYRHTHTYNSEYLLMLQVQKLDNSAFLVCLYCLVRECGLTSIYVLILHFKSISIRLWIVLLCTCRCLCVHICICFPINGYDTICIKLFCVLIDLLYVKIK